MFLGILHVFKYTLVECGVCACAQPHMQCMSLFVVFKSTVCVHTVSWHFMDCVQ